VWTLIWCAYVKLSTANRTNELGSFTVQFPLLAEVYNQMFNGCISNIEATDRMLEIFNEISSAAYHTDSFIGTDIIFSFVNTKLSQIMDTDTHSIFGWTYQSQFLCHNCQNRIDLGSPHVNCGIQFDADSITAKSLLASINTLCSRSSRKRRQNAPTCQGCKIQMRLSRKTLSLPLFLLIKYPIEKINQRPDYVDQHIVFEGSQYELVGVSYGNGSHFVDRLCFENKAHYADGMKRDDYTNIRQAISFEINEPVERAFPKQCKEPMRIKIKTRQNTARGSTFTLNDILYLKCS
jgi:hypothetical protein